MINIFMAPPGVPQILTPSPQPPPQLKLNTIDNEILAVLRRSGRYGEAIWVVLEQVADCQNPSSRSERRFLRQNAWQRLRFLMHAGLVHRFGRKCVSLWKIQHVSVRRKRLPRPGSTDTEHLASDSQIFNKNISTNLIFQNQHKTPVVEVKETQSAPAPEEVVNAARSLASLPRRTGRHWSGWIGEIRCFRNMQIQLADGRMVYVFGARRGRVIFTSQPDGLIGSVKDAGREWGVVPACEMQIVKNNAARVLGRKKKGILERKSEGKARAARANGSMPCKPGRRRGRPKKVETI